MSAADLRDEYDVVVVGAGPAGSPPPRRVLAPGFRPCFDEQASPGGQIYRSITDTPVINESLLGPDY
jgi:flavin-dependent dehydrogenase